MCGFAGKPVRSLRHARPARNRSDSPDWRLPVRPSYHQRSKVDSTFSAVKRKFGDAVRSRTDAGMADEVLAKFVCFDLTRVILSQVELGIDTNFWKADDGPRDVIPLRCGG